MQKEVYDNGNLKVINGDCLEVMAGLDAQSIDVVTCSPPYNIGKKYSLYKDNQEFSEFFAWLDQCFSSIKRVLKPDGSFFLNVGSTYKYPHLARDICIVAERHFSLQHQIIWLKAVSIGDKNFGHFKPVISERYVHSLYEHVFHLVHDEHLKVDRLAIGVPYTDKFNTERFASPDPASCRVADAPDVKKADKRCRGNVWFIPYQTTSPKTSIKKNHPASFPPQLPENCILLHGLRNDIKVLDPFLGTGATLLACQKLGVSGIGIDIDLDYCQIAKEIIEANVLHSTTV